MTLYKSRSALDRFYSSRQTTINLAADGYGYYDIAVKLAELQLPVSDWVKWWVLHGMALEAAANNKKAVK